MNIDFPLHFDGRGRTAICDDDAHIRDMIEQFLFTNPGERVNRPDFGSGLLQLVFEPNGPELAAALQQGIKAGLQRYLEDVIQVTDLNVTARDSSLSIQISYRVLASGESRKETFERSLS